MFKKKRKTAKLWYDAKIPAWLFFEILSTDNLKLLKKDEGYAKKSDLQRNWAKIYDEYFILKGDPKLATIITTQMDIIKMVREIEQARQIAYAICSVKMTEDQLKRMAQPLIEMGFSFDLDNPLDSVLKIIKEEIPSIETRIEIEKDNLQSLKDGEASTFEENCVAYEGWGYKIDEDCSLRRYVAYEKSVIKKAQKQKQSDGKRKVN